MWQELRSELYPAGLEIVTVALDTGGSDAARRHVERAKAEHPSLIDTAHRLDELLGVVNVPSAVWIDEEGRIVRGPETAFSGPPAGTAERPPREAPADATAEVREAYDVLGRLKVPKGYPDAIRDWVHHGAKSRFVLNGAEVSARSHPRTPESSEAAACFQLGRHLWGSGHAPDAVAWFKQAHELQPNNWTYRRQAWGLVPDGEAAPELYGTDWMTEVKRTGPENYYPAVSELEY